MKVYVELKSATGRAPILIAGTLGRTLGGNAESDTLYEYRSRAARTAVTFLFVLGRLHDTALDGEGFTIVLLAFLRIRLILVHLFPVRFFGPLGRGG